jgi:CheY-like chemotaxis protein
MSAGTQDTTGAVLLIDDDQNFLDLMQERLRVDYPELTVLACSDPLACLSKITAELRLLLVDLEMPGIDGAKVLSYATAAGLNKNRIIVLSAHDAEYLHKRFPLGSCLAVLNKHEARQQEALDMVLRALTSPRAE